MPFVMATVEGSGAGCGVVAENETIYLIWFIWQFKELSGQTKQNIIGRRFEYQVQRAC